DPARDVVKELRTDVGLDVAHFVYRREVAELSPLDRNAYLASANLERLRIEAGGRRDLGAYRTDVDVLVQHDIHGDAVFAQGVDRRQRQEAGRARCRGAARGRAQRRRDLEILHVDVGPGDKWQCPDRRKVVRRIPAQIRVIGHVFEDFGTQFAELRSLRAV